MRRRTTLAVAIVLAVGAFLGYLAATGKIATLLGADGEKAAPAVKGEQVTGERAKDASGKGAGKERQVNPEKIIPEVAAKKPGLEAPAYTADLGGGIKMEFVRIEPGELDMGTAEGSSEEQPQHKVTIGRPFYMATCKTTQARFAKLLERKPSYFSETGGGKDKVAGINTSQFPVDSVNWFDAVEFCNKLSARQSRRPCYELTDIQKGNDGSITSAKVKLLPVEKAYRLPSEAEWEYCARAEMKGGKKGAKYWFGDDEGKLGQYAWFNGNSGSMTHPVGKKDANPLGLYDMGGLLWEWCGDVWHDNYQGVPSDGSAWLDSDPNWRVLRGGSWCDYASNCRSAIRIRGVAGNRFYSGGFRVVLVSP